MIRRLLIANRGEIACRVIRSARRLGIETVAVYSEADRDALHVREADRAVCLGPAPPLESYLDLEAVMGARAASGADALHPGYGFLAEDPRLAEACEAAGCVFVGPPAAAMRAMSGKIEAKRIAERAGLAVVPGYLPGKGAGERSLERFATEAARIGYPVLLKPSAGGGGRGMRSVTTPDELPEAFEASRREAAAAFGDDTLLLEKYLEAPRHIEIQILADAHGHCLHLFERDCSVQRRHQKLIEEAPAPLLDEALRRRIGEDAVKLARAIAYRGAGTVELIGSPEALYFMEMNTRLQVEHPVTEAVLGLDLVEWQLRIAAGERLPFEQDALVPRGHAMEARLYAENPARDFLPSTGRLVHVAFPQEARVDAGVETGSEVSAHYDALLAKLIVHAPERMQAVAALDRALAATELAGVEHNLAFLRAVLADRAFRAGRHDVRLIERRGAALIPEEDPRALLALALAWSSEASDAPLWRRRDAFRVNLPWTQRLRFTHGARHVELRCTALGDGYRIERGEHAHLARHVRLEQGVLRAHIDGEPYEARILRDGADFYCLHDGASVCYRLYEDDPAVFEREVSSDGRIVAPLPGRVTIVHVTEGDRVEHDQPLMVLEAMKMEHVLRAPVAGTVERLAVAAGSSVEEGAELAVIGEMR